MKHIAHVPFIAVCGANEPDQATVRDNDDAADCLACFREKVRRQTHYIELLNSEIARLMKENHHA